MLNFFSQTTKYVKIGSKPVDSNCIHSKVHSSTVLFHTWSHTQPLFRSWQRNQGRRQDPFLVTQMQRFWGNPWLNWARWKLTQIHVHKVFLDQVFGDSFWCVKCCTHCVSQLWPRGLFLFIHPKHLHWEVGRKTVPLLSNSLKNLQPLPKIQICLTKWPWLLQMGGGKGVLDQRGDMESSGLKDFRLSLL